VLVIKDKKYYNDKNWKIKYTLSSVCKKMAESDNMRTLRH
jgi:hypothetical protein